MTTQTPPGPTGVSPEELNARLAKGKRIVSLAAALFGAAGGAFFAWNVRPVIASGIPLLPFAAGGAVLGAIIGVVIFRVKFANVTPADVLPRGKPGDDA